VNHADRAHAEGPSADRDNELAELLAARAVAVHRRTHQDTVRVAGRPSHGQETLLTVEFSGDPSFAELREQVRAALRHPAAAAPGTAADVRYHQTATKTAASPGDGAGDPDGSLDRQARLILAAGREDPRCPVSALPMAGEADRARLLHWGRYGEPTVRGECVHTMVAAQADRAPGAPALCCGDTVLTYRQLDTWADRLAAVLTGQGTGTGDVVGVLAGRSPELVAALLAVLKCGAAYLALEAGTPAERTAQLLENARVTTVLTHGAHNGAPAGTRAVPIRGLAELPAATPPRTRVRPDDLAYISYTSGSTGQPKGVCVPHAAVSRLIREPDWAGFSAADTFLQLAPVAFDASTLEIWAPLTIGARLAIHPPGRIDLDELASTLTAEGVTVLWLTAGLFHQMVENRLDALGGLRHLIAGGDVIFAGAVQRLLARHPHLTFTNGYGPTENTTFTTCWTTLVPPGDDAVPIGRPVRGTRVTILDPLLRPVPVGVPGELYTGGAGLARGYAGQAAASAERFVADPLAGQRGARMYRTGDLARWRQDGCIEFLGRTDRQLKIQGYRVEPGEVEAALVALPGTRSALVIAEPDSSGGQRLAAFVTPEQAEADPVALATQLRAEFGRRLPPYLVPSRLLVVDRLPLNPNGKVDRSLFDRSSRAPRTVGNRYLAPQDAMESFLAELWAATLGIETVGVQDDFFELGGHSLIAGELIGRLQQEFGIDIPARVLYMSPTVAELTEAIRGLLGAGTTQARGAERR
jgi:amino acid adenylation domain-containing protein